MIYSLHNPPVSRRFEAGGHQYPEVPSQCTLRCRTITQQNSNAHFKLLRVTDKIMSTWIQSVFGSTNDLLYL